MSTENQSDIEIVWFFEFGLESGTGQKLDRKYAEELLQHIIDWAEERDLQIGGGYRKPKINEI